MLNIAFLFSLLLLIAVIVEPYSKKLHIPFTSFLVIIGFVVSELLVSFGIDTGLRWHSFVNIILYLFVPIIVFEAAFNINFNALLSNIKTILFLAIPAMIFASAITGLLIFLLIGNNTYFPLTSALLAGVILSATDPVAVIAIFKRLGAPPKLTTLLEGESLFNDATAIVLFTIIIGINLNISHQESISIYFLKFFKSFIGGAITGYLSGYLTQCLFKPITSYFGYTLVGIVSAVFSFYLAEEWLQVSGIVSVLITGVILGQSYRKQITIDHGFASKYLELNAYISNAILFLLIGITITPTMFTSHWLAMIIGIFSAILSRAIVIYGLLPPFIFSTKLETITTADKHVLMWGGLRGAVSIALALSIPTEVIGWNLIQSIIYGVVIFTLFVQAPIIDKLVIKTVTR